MPQSNTNAAGVDVGKTTLDLAIHGSPQALQVSNTAPGWHKVVEVLRQAGVERVGLEASGGYERGLADHLRGAGFTVVLLQPIQVRAFAKAGLRRAKNDRLDAALIAAFTALCGGCGTDPDPRLGPLADLLLFIEQLEDDLVRAKTRLEHTRPPRLRRLIEADIARLTKRRSRELVRLIAALRAHADLAQRLDLLVSIPGIGERTAVTLVVALPELGHLSREKVAALVGLCPFDDDSADRHGERHIGGGRARVRRALYAAAVPAATRWNPALVAFYRRLREHGKAPKEAFVACARKLLILANTILARQTPWRPIAP
jgi:transposase